MTLDVYLERTKPLRIDPKKQLLQSYVNPHKVCSSTISGWITKVLNLARVDTSVFKGRYSRSAASSGVELAGASVSDLFKYGLIVLMKKFGNSIIIKPVLTPEASFQRKLL